SQHTINLYQAIDQIKVRFGEDKLIRAAGELFKSPKTISCTSIAKQTSVFDMARSRRKNW
ncbi:MAG TPA: hypothetical protein VK628_01140, partial [Flavitalea sp.]|nr:hypothetical protein [Flavitalea sp.]